MNEAIKKYKTGMYGGKFLPFHLGHRYCVETAAKECETVYVIMFCGGVDEETATEDACRIEHYISDKTFDAIKAHMKQHGA